MKINAFASPAPCQNGAYDTNLFINSPNKQKLKAGQMQKMPKKNAKDAKKKTASLRNKKMQRKRICPHWPPGSMNPTQHAE